MPDLPVRLRMGQDVTGRRTLVLTAASHRRFCPLCHGAGRVLLWAAPDGLPVPTPCLHCGRDTLPIVHLPAYVDIPRSA